MCRNFTDISGFFCQEDQTGKNDRILLIAVIYMLMKDGADKELIIALVYIMM